MRKLQLHHRAAKVLYAAPLVLVLTACGSKATINVNDYLTTSFTGYESGGTAAVELDTATMVADNYDAFGLTESDSLMQFNAVIANINQHLTGEFDKQEELSNGDQISFQWDKNGIQTLEDTYDIKLKAEDLDLTVSDLEEIVEINPFDLIQLEFSGISPHGNAAINNSELNDTVGFTISFDISKSSELEMGETITVSLISGAYEASLAQGYLLTETSHDYTVDNLDAYLAAISDLPEDANQKMDSNAQDKMKADIASTWENPNDLQSITLMGKYLLTVKPEMYSYAQNSLVYVYNLETTGGLSYYYYVQYDNIMMLADGTCSFNLAEAQVPYGANLLGTPTGTAFEHNGLIYIGYKDIDTLFNDVVTAHIDTYTYESTVS